MIPLYSGDKISCPEGSILRLHLPAGFLALNVLSHSHSGNHSHVFIVTAFYTRGIQGSNRGQNLHQVTEPRRRRTTVTLGLASAKPFLPEVPKYYGVEEWPGACSDGSSLGPTWEKQGRGLGTRIVSDLPRQSTSALQSSAASELSEGVPVVTETARLPSCGVFPAGGLALPGFMSARGHLSPGAALMSHVSPLFLTGPQWPLHASLLTVLAFPPAGVFPASGRAGADWGCHT